MKQKNMKIKKINIIDNIVEQELAGIGETGLDFYNHSDKADQVSLFLEHIEAAQQLKSFNRCQISRRRNIIFHQAVKKNELFLIHCFTGSKDLL